MRSLRWYALAVVGVVSIAAVAGGVVATGLGSGSDTVVLMPLVSSATIAPSGTGAAVGSAAGSQAPSGSGEPVFSGAAALLHLAVRKIQGQNLVFAVGDGISRADGTLDARTGALGLTRVEDGRRAEIAVFGGDVYVSGFVPDGSVLHLSADQIQPGGGLLPTVVPLAALSLLSGVVRAEVSVNTYTGRIDLAKVDTVPASTLRRFVDYLTAQAGDRLHDISFVATVDGFGQLASFRATFPKADVGHDLEYEVTFRDVGGGVTVNRPTAKVVEAPAGAYQF